MRIDDPDECDFSRLVPIAAGIALWMMAFVHFLDFIRYRNIFADYRFFFNATQSKSNLIHFLNPPPFVVSFLCMAGSGAIAYGFFKKDERRFSLLGLVLFVLLIGCAGALPWIGHDRPGRIAIVCADFKPISLETLKKIKRTVEDRWYDSHKTHIHEFVEIRGTDTGLTFTVSTGRTPEDRRRADQFLRFIEPVLSELAVEAGLPPIEPENRRKTVFPRGSGEF
ncbi:MAG TPA: hypothetical protein VEK08_11820 [Planctomycetota bacterium]|nr:hypothetical protein [Planctomycetota bacterium]